MKTVFWFPTFFAAAILAGTTALADSCLKPEFAGARISGVGSLVNGGGLVLGVLVTDLNGDTNADVVTINDGCAFCTPPITNSLSVLLGYGDGTFLTNVNYFTSLSPSSVAGGDFTGDQRPDLVVSFAGSPLVSVFINNGNGTFQPPVSVNVSNASARLFVADFNADGDLDFVAGGRLALGNGNGTFQPVVVFGGNGAGVTGDFDGDGTTDIASQSFDQFTFEPRIATTLGSTNGTFQTTNSVVSVSLVSLAAGDFNGDTFPDLAGGCLSNFVGVCLNRGDGTFQTNVNYAISTNGTFVAVADFNGDLTPDIAVTSSANVIAILLGNGNGTFQPASNYPLGGHAIPSLVRTGDINGDGIPDLVTASGSGANGVSVMLGNGDGTFHIAPAYRTVDGPLHPQAGDFDGDGFRDLVVANNFSNNVSVLLNNGDGTFGTNINYTTGRNPQAIAVADYNKDNKLDLIVAHSITNQVSFRLGLGNGAFQTNFAIRGAALIGGSWNAVAGDFNGDTNPDFAVGTLFGISVFPGNGSGGFQTNSINTATAPVMISGDILVTGDFNNDNKLDLVYSKTGSNIVCVILGNGAGGFGVNNNFPMVSSNIISVAIADFNTDGKLDLVAIHYPSCPTCYNPYQNDAGNLTVRLGNGNGTFQPPLHYAVPAYFLWGMLTGDFNGDGKPDVAMTDLLVGEVLVLLGKGDGSFENKVRFGVQLSPESLCAADLDGNGTIDLVAANKAVDTLSVLINTCPFAPPATLTCVLTPLLATNNVSTAHTVTATVTSNGTAAVGVLVNFSVTGVNVGQTGTATTSVSGQGSFTYTGSATPGADTIRAIAGVATGTATKVWVTVSCPTITVSPTTLPDGTVGAAYNQTITATGGQAPRTFALTNGTLPAGLVLSSAGTLSGTPGTMGASGFTVTATDANDCTGNRAYTLAINDAPPELHDLAVVKLKAPKKIKFSGTPVIGKFSVGIQNNGAHDEVIPDFATLTNLVTVSVQSLSNSCPDFAATMTLPKKAFPLTLAPKKKLNLAFTGTFNCVNDPLATSKTAAHNDYRTTAHVSHAVLGGSDSVPANDDCPHAPFGTDIGCGGKPPGSDVFTDVIDKR